MSGVGQNHLYTVYIWYIRQEIFVIQSHIWCIYTVLANTRFERSHALLKAFVFSPQLGSEAAAYPLLSLRDRTDPLPPNGTATASFHTQGQC